MNLALAIRAAFRAHSLRPLSGRLLVAVSGGVDSTVLLDALERSAAKLGLTLTVAHVDHAVRADSVADADFVRGLAEARRLPFLGERLDGSARSEDALRKARYDALARMMAGSGCERLALGHTRDDQVETFLFRLLRGAGPRGAGAMRFLDGDRVRPLLDVPRGDVLAYARSRGLSWRDDPTNADPRFSRNRLRHQLLPVLRALAPAGEGAIARFAQALQHEHAVLDAIAQALIDGALVASEPGTLVIDLERVPIRLLPALVPALPGMVERVTNGFPELSQAHFDAFADLLAARGRPRVLHLPEGVRVARRRFVLRFSRLTDDEREEASRARGLKNARETL
jgi:tRNA(Ile)-lysidine synthase